MIGYFCNLHANEYHQLESNQFHIWQRYNNLTDTIDHNVKLDIRTIELQKTCNCTIRNRESRTFTLVTLYGHLGLNILYDKCSCTSFITELLFNGIFPGTPSKPCI